MQKIVRKVVKKIIIFKHTVTFLILLLFLAGTLGISAREHICNSSKKVTVTLFPELGNPVSGCCCSFSFTGQGPSSGSDDQRTIGDQACCKTIHLFLKAAFLSLQLHLRSLQIPDPVTGIVLLTDNNCPESSEFLSLSSFYTDTGPPVSGRQRILAWHQCKIPLPHLMNS